MTIAGLKIQIAQTSVEDVYNSMSEDERNGLARNVELSREFDLPVDENIEKLYNRIVA